MQTSLSVPLGLMLTCVIIERMLAHSEINKWWDEFFLSGFFFRVVLMMFNTKYDFHISHSQMVKINGTSPRHQERSPNSPSATDQGEFFWASILTSLDFALMWESQYTNLETLFLCHSTLLPWESCCGSWAACFLCVHPYLSAYYMPDTVKRLDL